MSKRNYMELTPGVLRYIRDNPGATSKNVADEFDLAVSTASKMLGTFSDRNWVKRRKTSTGNRGPKTYACKITDYGLDKLDYCKEIEKIIKNRDVDWKKARKIHRKKP